MSSIHAAIDTYQINMALAHGSSRLCALTRLRAVVREDRERTRLNWGKAIDEYAKRSGQPVRIVR